MRKLNRATNIVQAHDGTREKDTRGGGGHVNVHVNLRTHLMLHCTAGVAIGIRHADFLPPEAFYSSHFHDGEHPELKKNHEQLHVERKFGTEDSQGDLAGSPKSNKSASGKKKGCARLWRKSGPK